VRSGAVLIIPLLIAAPGKAAGSPAADTVESAAKTSVPALARYDGRVIDSLSIDNRNIFDTDVSPYDNFLFRLANRLNIVTRRLIIGRELLFQPGDTFSVKLAGETTRNLRTAYSIYEAWFEADTLSNGHLHLHLITVDQWSLTGGLRVSREGNETDFEIGFTEDNFLGLNQRVTAQYEIQEKDDNFFELEFRDRRILGRPYSFGVRYKDDPTDDIRQLDFGRPFYDLSQLWSFYAAVATRRAREEYYSDGDRLVARSFGKGDDVTVQSTWRWGTYHHKIGIRALYDYRFETALRNEILDDTDTANLVFPGDSLHHQVRIGSFVEWVAYVTTSRLAGFVYTEDVTLGYTLGGNVGRAFSADFNDHVYDLIELEGSARYQLGSNWLFVDGRAGFWYRANDEQRRVLELTGRFFNNRLSFATLAARGRYLADLREDRSARIELGGRSGLRGYDRRFEVGDRLMVLNLESRWYLPISFFTVKVGGALFIDVGRTWKEGEPISISDFHSAPGAGLRLSFERISRGQIVRIDLARNQQNRWDFSVGTGQYF
jgi:hypothetical protein